jgi:hypothetical protein
MCPILLYFAFFSWTCTANSHLLLPFFFFLSPLFKEVHEVASHVPMHTLLLPHSGVFLEMKCLFSIAPEARKGGESSECLSLKKIKILDIKSNLSLSQCLSISSCGRTFQLAINSSNKVTLLTILFTGNSDAYKKQRPPENNYNVMF